MLSFNGVSGRYNVILIDGQEVGLKPTNLTEQDSSAVRVAEQSASSEQNASTVEAKGKAAPTQGKTAPTQAATSADTHVTVQAAPSAAPLSHPGFDVSGGNFVITGGTQGLGFEIASQLQRQAAACSVR